STVAQTEPATGCRRSRTWVPAKSRGGRGVRPLLFIPRSAAHQRAFAFVQRTEGFVCRNSGAELVEIAGIFRFRWFLHFEQVGRMNDTAVGANLTFAEQRIIRWHRLHLGDNRLAIMLARTHGQTSLQIVGNAGIDTGM